MRNFIFALIAIIVGVVAFVPKAEPQKLSLVLVPNHMFIENGSVLTSQGMNSEVSLSILNHESTNYEGFWLLVSIYNKSDKMETLGQENINFNNLGNAIDIVNAKKLILNHQQNPKATEVLPVDITKKDLLPSQQALMQLANKISYTKEYPKELFFRQPLVPKRVASMLIKLRVDAQVNQSFLNINVLGDIYQVVMRVE